MTWWIWITSETSADEFWAWATGKSRRLQHHTSSERVQ